MPYTPVPGSVLALDIASRTGWAFGAPNLRPAHGVIVLPPPGMDLGGHGAAFADGMADLLTVHRPARVVVEAPFYQAKGQAITIEALLGLNMMAHTIAYRWALRISKVPAVTARKSMLGRTQFGGRDQGKAAVMAWCRAQGWKPTDDNAGDALVLLAHELNWKSA